MQTIAILQRFRPDDLFTAAQQQRLRELMDQSKRRSPKAPNSRQPYN